MTSSFQPTPRQGGGAAVEMALLLPFFVLLLSLALFLGRCFWHYEAAQKAAQDASRYLSTISEEEIRDVVLAPAAAEVARDIARMELAGLFPGRTPPRIDVQCGGATCLGATSGPLPDTVTVTVSMDMFDPIFGVAVGRRGLLLTARSEVRYVGT